VTYDNSSGLKYVWGNPVSLLSLLDFSYTGGATPSDPTVLSYAYEFTESEATTLNFPDLSSDITLTCYMSPGVVTSLSPSNDISTLPSLIEETVSIGTGGGVGVGSTPTSGTDNTSGAMELIKKKTILALLVWLGLKALY